MKNRSFPNATLLGFLSIASLFYAAPRMFKRAFAPPHREVAQTPDLLGLPNEAVWLTSVTGTQLHAWFIPVEHPAPVVIVLHGWGGNASLMLPLAPHLHSAGFHSLFVDARNHGLSEHDTFVSMPRFAEDLEVAADWVRHRHEVTAIGALGHSVGAGAVILSASRSDRYGAVVSVSSFAHPGEMMREQMDRLPAPLLNMIMEAVQRTIGYRFETFAPRYRLPQVDAPVMLMHGDSDPVVPVADLLELSAIRPDAEVVVVRDGGHSDLAPFEPYVQQITDFFRAHLQAE